MDTGHVYGAVDWGFTVSDVFKGTVTDEHSAGRPTASATVWQALKLFKEYYRNRGTSTAPTTPPPAHDWHPWLGFSGRVDALLGPSTAGDVPASQSAGPT